MATVYNKTALKKIKKDDLIEMFLDQQAKMNDMQLSREENQEQKNVLENYRQLDKNYSIIVDKMKNELRARAFTIIDLRNENEKLKTDIGYLKHQKSIQRDKLKEFMDEINKLNKENRIKRQIKNWENPPDY